MKARQSLATRLLSLVSRLFPIFWRRKRTQRDFSEELQAHLALETDRLREEGMSEEEASAAARRNLGNITQAKERFYESHRWLWLDYLWQDLRFGLRQLRRNPGFTAVAIITLALGIGATTAIFSVVNGVLLKPLPYPQPKQLVAVWLTAPGISIRDLNPPASLYFICREQGRAFQDIGLYMGYSVNVTGLGEPEHVAGLEVTDSVLTILGVTPSLGRLFTQADDSPGSPDTVMLTYAYWRRAFGGDRRVIGKTITVDGKLRQVIGVLPQQFHFGGPDLALMFPMKLDRAKTFIGPFNDDGIARLKPGVTLTQANADVARMLRIVQRSFPPLPGMTLKELKDARTGPNLRPLKQDVIGDVGKVLWVLMGGIGLVLLIACANVANLLLVRVEGRRQELAIRAALGANRGRIAAQMLIEGFILVLLGSAFGLGLAYVAVRALVAMAPSGLPRLNDIGIDGAVVLFMVAVTVAVTLLIGSIPILKYAGVGLGTGIREDGRTASESQKRHRSRSVLVTVQVALALVLLVGAGLMIRTFRVLTRVDPGFVTPSGIQTFRIDIPETQVKNPVRVVHLEQEILRKIKTLPGVSSVGLSMSVPMDGNEWTGPVFAKDHEYTPGELPLHRHRFVAPGFFKTLGTPLIAGRDFTWNDIYNKIPVAIVSKKLAREYWHSPSAALGKQIRVTAQDDWRTVVGVVGDIREDGIDRKAPSSVYWPILAAHFEGNDIDVIRWAAVLIRSPRAGSESLMNEVKRAVWSLDPNLPLANVHTLAYYEQQSMARTSFTLTMLGLAGGMALLIGIVGLYAVISYSISQRTHEIGIRMALGAQKQDVLRLVVGQGMILALIGVGIGIIGALGLTRFLSSLLYGVKPTDPVTFVAVSLILTAVALLACYIPARRAMKIDPMEALRYE